MRNFIFLSYIFFHPLHAEEINLPKREVFASITYAHLLKNELDGGPSGFGLGGEYDFVQSEKFSLGIDMKLRNFSKEKTVTQLGYGLIMKHNFREAGYYLSYGLLMQALLKSNVKGMPTAHDTKLALGYFGFPTNIFVEISYHYSMLRPWGGDQTNLNYVQLDIGSKVKSW